jgi:hypothetical protein
LISQKQNRNPKNVINNLGQVRTPWLNTSEGFNVFKTKPIFTVNMASSNPPLSADAMGNATYLSDGTKKEALEGAP